MIRLLHHPLYRREKARLGFIRAWHWAALALALLVAALVSFRLMLCGRGTLPLMSIILAQEGLKEIMCLGAGLLGGAAARSEDEERDLLRITPLTARAVVAAKLGAALQRLWLPIALVMLARLVILLRALLGTLPISCYVLIPGLPNQPFLPMAPDASRAVMAIWQSHLQELILYGARPALPMWAVYFILQPIVDAALFGALGLAAGAASRLRSAGRIAVAVGWSAALWMAGYAALNLLQIVFIDPMISTYRPGMVLFVGTTWMGNGVFFGYLLLNLWTAGIPAFPYSAVDLPYRLILLIGGVATVKLGLIAGLVRIAERGIGHSE